MDTKIGMLLALLVVGLIPGIASAGSIGVVQDYMEDGVVKVPQGMDLVCHSISAATDPSITSGAVKIEVSDVPDFVTANLKADGLYQTTKGQGEGVTFFIRPPKDSPVGTEWHVGFTVSGIENDSETGMVKVVGKIGSGFTIRIVDANATVPLPKCTITNNTIPETILHPEKYRAESDNNTNDTEIFVANSGAVVTEDSNPLDGMLIPLVGVSVAIIGAVFVLRRRRAALTEKPAKTPRKASTQYLADCKTAMEKPLVETHIEPESLHSEDPIERMKHLFDGMKEEPHNRESELGR